MSRNTPCAGLPRDGGDPPRWSAQRKVAAAIAPRRSRAPAPACSVTDRAGLGLAVKLEEQRGGSGALVESPANRLTASIGTSSSNSTRATGMPSWIVWMTVSTAPSIVFERADGRSDRIGDAEPSRTVTSGDDAERSLGADEQPGEVVAGCSTFAPVRPGPDHPAVGEDDGEPEHRLAHCPVAHGSRCPTPAWRPFPRSWLSAPGSSEEGETVPSAGPRDPAAYPGDAGFDGRIEVLGAHSERCDSWRVRRAHTPPAIASYVSLDRCARAEGHDRRAVPGADPRRSPATSSVDCGKTDDVGSVRSGGTTRRGCDDRAQRPPRTRDRTAARGDRRRAGRAKRHGSRNWLPKPRGVHAIIAREHAQDFVENGEVRSLLGLSPVREQLMDKNTRRDAVI